MTAQAVRGIIFREVDPFTVVFGDIARQLSPCLMATRRILRTFCPELSVKKKVAHRDLMATGHPVDTVDSLGTLRTLGCVGKEARMIYFTGAIPGEECNNNGDLKWSRRPKPWDWDS